MDLAATKLSAQLNIGRYSTGFMDDIASDIDDYYANFKTEFGDSDFFYSDPQGEDDDSIAYEWIREYFKNTLS